MALVPQGMIGRLAAAAYALTCFGLFVFAVSARDIRDTDIAVAYAMLLLSFPAGYVAAALLAGLGYALEKASGADLPGGLVGNATNILVLGAAGYAQWFILIPWLRRRFRGAI